MEETRIENIHNQLQALVPCWIDRVLYTGGEEYGGF